VLSGLKNKTVEHNVGYKVNTKASKKPPAKRFLGVSVILPVVVSESLISSLF
jgi:hypothetical protein